MSRDIRQKHPRTPVQASKRRGSRSSSSPLNLSDDDGYSGVDDVSDTEDDDEEHVFAVEEEHIISRALCKGPRGSPRPDQNDNEEDADEEKEDVDENEGDDEEDGDEDEDEDEDADADASASWDGVLSDIDDSQASDSYTNGYILDQDVANVERHVRFAGVPDSDSDSTTTDTSEDIGQFFPDIFVAQSSLDPAFRREIEHDPDDSSNSSSFWDLHGSYDRFGDSGEEAVAQQAFDDDTPVATPITGQFPVEVSTPVAVSDEVQELDGYESEFD
jgi:hypothetical protein